MDEQMESPRSDMDEHEPGKHESNLYLRVGPEEYEKFCGLSSADDRWEYMSSFSTISYHSDNARSEILQEYLFHILLFCVENNLAFSQMSVIVVLSEDLFSKCALNSDVKTDDAKLVYRELVNENILANEDSDAKISIVVLKMLTVFHMENFIRHLVLYQTVFSQEQKESHATKCIAVQSPLLFPSLMEANNYNGEDIGVETARTDYTEEETGRSEYEQGDTARTDYTEYTEDEN